MLWDVVFDTRELGSGGSGRKKREIEELVSKLRASGLRVCFSKLPVGDVYIPPPRREEKGFVFELKTPTDLVGSVASGRLWGQLHMLASVENATPILAIIGYLGVIDRLREKVGMRWKPQHVMGVLEAFSKAGVAVLVFPDRKVFGQYLLAKAKQLAERRAESPELQHGEPRISSVEDHVRYVLHGVVGEKTAEALLRKFGSIDRIVHAEPEELAETRVGGRRLGKKKAEELWKIFHTEYSGKKS